jgi:hypothetical protein
MERIYGTMSYIKGTNARGMEFSPLDTHPDVIKILHGTDNE